MVAKKATAGSGRRGSRIRTKQGAATNKEPLVKKAVRTAAKATTTRKPAPAAPKTAATARKTAGSRQDSKIAVAHRESPDFSKVMETLKRVRAKSDEIDERISRLAANLA